MDRPKLAICLTRNIPGYTWETTLAAKWLAEPEKLPGLFIHRSKNICLVAGRYADVYVTEDHGQTETQRKLQQVSPRGYEELYRVRPATPLAEIPWSDYDIVISMDPYLPSQVLERNDATFFAYFCAEHTHAVARASVKHPWPRYRLYLDHTMKAQGNPQSKLPSISMPFPAIASRKVMHRILPHLEKRPAIFFDSHNLRNERKRGKDPEKIAKEIANLLGMPIVSQPPAAYDDPYLAVAQKTLWSTRRWLEEMGACKYFLLMRGGPGLNGQAAIEAASLGCIVFSGPGIYPSKLCHARTIVNYRSWSDTVAAILEVEKNPDLQEEILAHQDKRLEDEFYKKPWQNLLQVFERFRKERE